MDVNKIKQMPIGSVITINGIKYSVVDKDRGVKPSIEVKEWILHDENGKEYLLQIVLNSEPSLWRMEPDPILKVPTFGEKDLIMIHSIELDF